MRDSDDVKFKNRQNEPMMIEIRKSVAPGIERIVKDLCGLMKLFYVWIRGLVVQVFTLIQTHPTVFLK